MKIAEIKDPTNIKIVRSYAQQRDFRIIEFKADVDEFPNITRVVNQCITLAQAQKCKEFCIHDIHYKYNIMPDTHTWYVTIIGFIK